MTPQRRRAFTLVELLTVIGIIVLLIGILLPVIASVRRAGWQTDSQAAIVNLSSAIERYQSDFRAYPGPAPNLAFNGTGAFAGRTETYDGVFYHRLTTSEFMVLALVGGWEPVGTGVFQAAQVGSGPMSHNPIASARRRWPPYIDAVPGQNLLPETPGGGPTVRWNRRAMTTADGNNYDTYDNPSVPEFIDRFPDAMPILYLRANVGATAVASESYSPTAPAQYVWNQLYPYIRDPDASNFPASSEDTNNNNLLDAGEDQNGNGTLDKDFATGQAYFRNPGIGDPGNAATWQPRQKDGFWLIGAGPDRKYGTRDDQTNFGGLNQ